MILNNKSKKIILNNKVIFKKIFNKIIILNKVISNRNMIYNNKT